MKIIATVISAPATTRLKSTPNGLKSCAVSDRSADYRARQLGSDSTPGGTVQSLVVCPGDTQRTIAQIYFSSPAYGDASSANSPNRCIAKL